MKKLLVLFVFGLGSAVNANAQQQAAEVEALAELSISDFTLTASDGALHPIGSASLDGVPFGEPSTNTVSGVFGQASSTGPVCVGACGTGANFVNATHSVSSLTPLSSAGASFRVSTEANSTGSSPFLFGTNSTATLDMQQEFTLSQASQLTVNFLASVDLQARIRNAPLFHSLYTVPDVQFLLILWGVKGAVFTEEMNWVPGTSIYGATVLSQPFDLQIHNLTECDPSRFCANQDTIYQNSGLFAAQSAPEVGLRSTDALPPGTYLLTIVAKAMESTGASVPEPASFGLLCLGLAGVGFMRRRKKN